MLIIKELITLISPQRIKNIKILGGINSKVRKFYKGISEGNIKDEETAIKFLFPDANNPKQAYADIKRAIRKSLIDALFIVNYGKEIPIYQKNYISCLKNYTAAKILISLGFREGAINLAEKTLNKATSNEFTEITLSLARSLSDLYASNTGNIKNYYKIIGIIKEQQIQLNKEILVQNCYTELIINLNVNKKQESFPSLLSKFKEIAENNIEESNTFLTIFYAYNILIHYYENKSDFHSIIKYSEEAIKIISKKQYSLPTLPFLYYYSKSIPYAFQNRQWEKAGELVDKCLALLLNKEYNYHAILVYRAMLGFHSGNYQLAYEALQLHKKAKLNAPLLKEQWQIIEAWVMLFAGWGKIDLDGQKPNFRVFKFFFQQKKYDKLLDMSTPFKLYAHRYLKPKVNARTRYIIRTVCAVGDCSF